MHPSVLRPFCYAPPMAVSAEAQTKRWTYEQYFRLDDPQRYEIIAGQLISMSPAPGIWHQKWVRELLVLLTLHTKEHQLGEVFVSPADVVLDDENTVQPDLGFVAASNVSIIQPRAIFGVPDLLIEGISPSSAIHDRHQKSELYARFGVKEYWLADPANRSIEIFVLEHGGYRLHSASESGGHVKSALLPGFEIDVAEFP